MSAIILIDTCVLLNIFNVPMYNDKYTDIFNEFNNLINHRNIFLLPMATIFETGNHIANLTDGGHRRKWSHIFVNTIKQTHQGVAPWRAIEFPKLDDKDIINWLDEFPGMAMSGCGFSDLSIIKDWEKMCKLHPLSEVRIWSIDTHLSGYQRLGKGV
ncbi:MAG: hypothetical protein H7839_16425 [Magnetococcus sp. YQC-5]